MTSATGRSKRAGARVISRTVSQRSFMSRLTSQVARQRRRAPYPRRSVSCVVPQRVKLFTPLRIRMPDVQRIFVVLGYGCRLDAPVRGYLEHAASRIRSAGEGLVITSGGCTAHTSAPGISEAGLMAEELRALGVTLPVLLEDAARTTVENLRNVARMIAARGIEPAAIHIFGDRARRRKIAALARYFLGPAP